MAYAGGNSGPTAGNSTAPSAPPTPATAAASNPLSAIASQIGSTNQGTVASGVLSGLSAPGIASSGLSMEQLLGQIGLTVPNAQEQAAYNTQQLGINEEGLAITQGQNTLAEQGLAAQLGLTTTQQGIEQQQYGLSQRQLQDQAAANGTLTTGAYGLAEGQQALGQASEEAGYQYSAGDIARSQQNLELAAAANGLSLEQLTSQFQQGLNQVGIQGDPTQLYTQYLAQQSSGVQDLGSAAAEGGLLTPGSLAAGAMAGGFNPNLLFAGVG